MLALHGEDADRYLHGLRDLLRVARPGRDFPDARRIDATLRSLGPAGSSGVSRKLEIDTASGLPSIGELLRVRADAGIAESFLARDTGDLPAKTAYYRKLLEAPLTPANEITVRLRRFTRAIAAFEVVYDRLDLPTRCFVRYSILLEETGRSHVSLERGDLSAPTETFRAVVERYASADSELAFLLMSDVPGVRVESVTRGQIGPFHSRLAPGPEPIRSLLASEPTARILHLPIERCGLDVARDSCRDPFSDLYRDSLSDDVRGVIESKRQALGYCVSKDRRLVCSPEIRDPLRRALRRAGQRVVVRSE